MTNLFYNPSGSPGTGSEGLSATMRAEFAAIGTAFGMMPQISTTGVYTTVFNQQGSYTFTLPGAPGTLAMLSDVATETARAEAAEALLAPLTAPAFLGSATLAGSVIQTANTLASPPAIGGVAPAAGAFTTLSASGAVSGAGFTNWLASPPAIGGVAPAAGAFTTLSASGAVSGAGFTNWLASPPAIGGVAPAAGAFTALNAASGNVFNDVGRNRIDNGNFEIAQRGTSGFAISGAYTLDRWIASWSAGTVGITQASGATYTCRRQLQLNATSLPVAATARFTHRIETARSYDLAGQTVTLSFNTAYTVSAGTTTFAVQFYYPTLGDTFGTLTAIGSPIAFTPSSGAPGNVSVSVAVPAAAVTGLQFDIIATQATATGNLTWDITSVQLEAGSVATPFERIDPALHPIRCLRFYQPITINLVSYMAAGQNFSQWLQFPVQMRAAPTIPAPTGVSLFNATGASSAGITAAGFEPYATDTALGGATLIATYAASADL